MPSATPPVPAENTVAGPSALRHAPSHLRLWLTAAGLLALDLWSKSWAFESLQPHEVRRVVPGLLVFVRSLNDGAVFGSMTGMVPLFLAASLIALPFVIYLFAGTRPRQWWLHVAFGMIVAGALGNLYDRAFIRADVVTVNREDGSSQTLIGRVLEPPGDATVMIGSWPEGTNARVFDADQVVETRTQGVVRDFLRLTPVFPSWVPKLGGRDMWPWVFNVADASLVCGVIVLLVTSWAPPKRRAAPEPEPASAAVS